MRRLLLLTTAVLLLAGAGQAATGIHFLGLPDHIFRGERVTFRIFGASSKTCSLTIRYAGKHVQRLKAKQAVNGVIAWTFRVPSVPPGTATLRIACGTASATARVPVRATLETPKLAVTRDGFTQRPHPYDAGSDLNFGIAVRNERLHTDATTVSILVNALDAANRVLGTAHVSAQRLPEAETIYLGGQIPLPTQTPVVKLETIFVSAKAAAHVASTPVLVSDAVVQPDTTGYIGNVHGQLLNKYPRDMQTALVGVLILDASGKVVGGGMGNVLGPVSLGAREAFELLGPFTALKWSSSLTAVFTTVPTYATS